MTPDTIIKTVIIDDDKESLFSLQDQLSFHPEIQLLGVATNYKRALSLLINGQPDLVFLDIEMPCKNGFELLQEARREVKNNFSVIFYTAYDKYMIEALRESAFDFLVKPVKQEELKLVIERYKQRGCDSPAVEIPLYQGVIGVPEIIALPTLTGLRFIDKKRIVLFQCTKPTLMRKPFWEAVLADRSHVKLKKETSLKEILSVVEEDYFISINQSVIVNLHYVNFVEYKTRSCVLFPSYHDLLLTVSRSQLSKLREKFDLL